MPPQPQISAHLTWGICTQICNFIQNWMQHYSILWTHAHRFILLHSIYLRRPKLEKSTLHFWHKDHICRCTHIIVCANLHPAHMGLYWSLLLSLYVKCLARGATTDYTVLESTCQLWISHSCVAGVCTEWPYFSLSKSYVKTCDVCSWGLTILFNSTNWHLPIMAKEVNHSFISTVLWTFQDWNVILESSVPMSMW